MSQQVFNFFCSSLRFDGRKKAVLKMHCQRHWTGGDSCLLLKEGCQLFATSNRNQIYSFLGSLLLTQQRIWARFRATIRYRSAIPSKSSISVGSTRYKAFSLRNPQ